MKLVRSTWIAFAFAIATAPARAGEPKQAPAEVTPAEARDWIALFDKVVDTVVVHRAECGKMAGQLNSVIDANQQTIAMAREAKAKGKRLPSSAQDHIVNSLRRMVAALDKCGN
jgi:hypothetical protein